MLRCGLTLCEFRVFGQLQNEKESQSLSGSICQLLLKIQSPLGRQNMGYMGSYNIPNAIFDLLKGTFILLVDCLT